MKARATLLLLLSLVYSNSFAVILNDSFDHSGTDFSSEGLFKSVKLSSDLSSIVSLYNAGDITQAKDLLASSLSKNPEDPDVLHVAGIILMQEKRYDNAEVAFEVALKSGVKKPAILSKLGVTRLLKGAREKGEKTLALALSFDPDNELALRYMVWVNEAAGLHARAVSFNSRLINSRKPKQLSSLHITQARNLVKLNQFEGVIKILKPFIKSKSKNNLNQSAFILMIEAYTQSRRFKSAASLLAKAKNNNVIGGLQLAVFEIELSIQQKKYAKSESKIKAAVKRYPEDLHILRFSASKALAQLGEYKRAIDQLKQVVAFLDNGKRKDKLFAALNDITTLYIVADRKVDALRLLQKYVKKYPDSLKLAYQFAELQVSVNQLAKAKSTLSDILKNDDRFMLAFYLNGVIARREKQHEKAEQWFFAANKIEPQYELAWVQRAGSFMDVGNIESALNILSNGLAKNAGSTRLQFEYGVLLGSSERHEKAIEAYKTLLNSQPNYLPAIDNLVGELLFLESNPREALNFSLKAIQMDPNDKAMQLNYLEALLQNKHYDTLLKDAITLEPGLKEFGRYHYLVGASYLESGNKSKGVKHLKLASKDSKLSKRHVSRITNLLNQ
jgi:predicted Zn-dependent protease